MRSANSVTAWIRKGAGFWLPLLILLFGTGQAVEILHPLEEGHHLPHHWHSGIAFHETLPCDADDASGHFCVHSVKLAPNVQLIEAAHRASVQPAGWDVPSFAPAANSTFVPLRGPPRIS